MLKVLLLDQPRPFKLASFQVYMLHLERKVIPFEHNLLRKANFILIYLIEHFKSYGVDKIFIYDYNDINVESFDDVLSDFIKRETKNRKD